MMQTRTQTATVMMTPRQALWLELMQFSHKVHAGLSRVISACKYALSCRSMVHQSLSWFTWVAVRVLSGREQEEGRHAWALRSFLYLIYTIKVV